ncbi:MAG: MBL fold metallo-hydrolase [Chitinophagaceae bacterium]|nr:MAG: MBL fold metallo-hydrolase [Chitinophagaceae bacterium]
MLTVKSFEFSPIQENTYILYNGFNNAVIIDPGCYFDDEKEELANFIDKMKLTPKMLLNTHCHLDHVFGNKFVAEKYGLTLQIHAGEKVVLDDAPMRGLMFNMPFDNYVGDIEYIAEDAVLGLDSDRLKVLFTPGHSPASLSFYNEEDGFVISGDALFRQSIGRTDLPGGDYDLLLSSIRSQLFTLPDETKVYSGHGPMTTIGFEKRNNPFLV